MSEPTQSEIDSRSSLQSAPASPEEKPASVWEDFIDIFYAPSAVFARRAQSGFFIPMVIVTLLTGVIFLLNSGVLAPMMDAEMQRGLAAAQRKGTTVTPEQLEQMRSVGLVFAKIAAFVFLPVGIFFVGLVLWIVGKLFESRQTFSQALMVTAYAYVPKVIEGVVAGVQGLLLDPSQLNGRFRISLGVGRFFDPDTASPMVLALVGRIDLFTIWVTVLLAIGLSVTGRISRQRAAIAGVIVWLIGAIPTVLQAARQ